MDKQGIILAVDDDPDMLNYMSLLLRSRGYEVLCASSGPRALEIAVSSMPDLVLLDVTMPGMNGYQVCAKLQEKDETAYIPVIFLTALGEEQNKARAFAVGAVDYIVKPVEERQLTEKIYTYIRNSKRWRKLREDAILPSDFIRFKEFLVAQYNLTGDKKERLLKLRPSEIYSLTSDLGNSSGQIAKMVAEFLKLPYLGSVRPEDVHLGIMPASFCRSNLVVAINDPSGETSFVLANPFNTDLIHFIKDSVGKGMSYRLFITEPDNIIKLLSMSFNTTRAVALPPPDVAMSELEEELRKRYKTQEEKTVEAADKLTESSEPIILLVNKIIEAAYDQRASDIHIEPWENEVVIRYRIDGLLQVVNRLRPASLIRPLVSRIKIMSKLDIAERRMPQDGRIVFKEHSRRKNDFDLRVATSPMNFGEKVVMRILDKQKSVLPLDQLGLSTRNLEAYRAKIKTPYGLVLHVGPTGSGKSMTLYAAINEVASPQLNIQTIEDPIEYTLAGINQLQVNHDIGLTFQRALRAFLRQDPNVILVGEIRDHETAHIAIEAALTGHLLVSTLHTNDAASTITRFLEMEIEPFMLSSSLVMVCAQRLLRRLCPVCKEAFSPDSEVKDLVGVASDARIKLYRPKGCQSCSNSGYKGRIGTHELLIPNDSLRSLINKKGITAEQLKKTAVGDCGMTTLYWDAMEKVRQGICSVEDVLAKVRRDEFDSRPQWMFAELNLPRPADSASPGTDKKSKTKQASTERYTANEMENVCDEIQDIQPIGKTPASTIIVAPADIGGGPDATLADLSAAAPSDTVYEQPSMDGTELLMPEIPLAVADNTMQLSSPQLATDNTEMVDMGQPFATEVLANVLGGLDLDNAQSQPASQPQLQRLPSAQTVALLPDATNALKAGQEATAKIVDDFPPLAAITGKQALDAFQNQVKLLKDIYLKNLPLKVKQIEESWRRLGQNPNDWGEWEELYRMVHSLVGSGATYGFKAVSEVARQLELVIKTVSQSKSLPTTEQRDQIGELLARFKRVSNEIK